MKMKKNIIEIISVLVAVLAITSLIITPTDVTLAHTYVRTAPPLVTTIIIALLYISLKTSKNNKCITVE